MNNEHIYRLFLFSDVSNEYKSSSDRGHCVLIESLAPRGKCDGVRASQVSHFRPSVWREVWNWTVKKSIIHLFIHLFSSLGESPNHEHPFVVLESLLCFHRYFGQGEILDSWEWFLLLWEMGIATRKGQTRGREGGEVFVVKPWEK